jgi:hypothetical protein
MNSYVYKIGDHIVRNILLPAYYFIAKWRYPLQDSQITELLPSINVPKKFDLVTSDVLAQRLNLAITGKFDPAIIQGLQIEFAKKEMGDDSLEAKIMKTISELDPLPGKTVDEKMTEISSNAISKEDYILSSNIQGFIQRAIQENDGFLDFRWIEKKKILDNYTQEVLKKTAGNVIPILPNGSQAA